MTYRKRYLALAGVLLVFAVGVDRLSPGRGSGPGADVSAGSKLRPPEKLTKRNAGVAYCAQCHESGKTIGEPPLCDCKEVERWLKHDKHAQAFKALDLDRTKEMERLLGWESGRAKRDNACLSCHAVASESPKDLAGAGALRFNLADGVSCVVCHGAYNDWYGPHQLEYDDWRLLSPEEKAKFGLTDLWGAAQRATLCVSCHIGETKAGRVLTHDMYAAGHPPLPGIEVATFSQEMPPHWTLLKDKKPEIQKLILRTRLATDPTAVQYARSKLVLVGALVAFRQTMQLVQTEASRAATAPPDQRRLDFAQFDCAACHHDLRTPGWRQTRGYTGKPGRPQLRQWPTALVRVALRLLKVDERQLDDQLKTLTAVFDDRPFGDPARVATAAKAVVDWVDESKLIDRLDRLPLDEQQVVFILKTLAALVDERLHDYDSARQIAWAFAIISDERNDPNRPAKLLEPLGQVLKLRLPSGTQKQILAELPDGLETAAGYEPAKFQEAFREVAKSLAAGAK